MRCLLIPFCLLFSLPTFAQARYLQLDTTKIWVETRGLEERKAGQPVVVFESGHGTPMDNWDRVVDGVSNLAPMVRYDRPGIGASEAVDERPTLQNVADRLVQLLQTLEVEPPYILVGHSLGGLYVRGFALYYPEMLAGLIIIDPADFTETLTNRLDYYEVLDWKAERVDSLVQSFVDRRNERHAQAPGPIRREGEVLEQLREQEFEAIRHTPLPNIPVHLITGGRFDMPERFRSQLYDDEALFRSKIKHRLWRWTEVVQSVDKGMLLYSGDAGHFVHYDDPELLISSVRMVLQDYQALLSSGK